VTGIYDRVRDFWNRNPCGSAHIASPLGTPEYFLECDAYFRRVYPYLDDFLDLESLRGGKVLEIGLGSGYTFLRISQVAGRCIGLDLSEETLRLNLRRKEISGSNAALIHASATDLPLADGSLDAVVTIGCLHHIPDIEQAVAEIRRVLKPGGVLKGMVYNRNSWRAMVYIPLARMLHPKFRGRTRQECINEMYDGSGNPHGMVYSRKEMAGILRGFGEVRFKVENFLGEEVVPRLGAAIPRSFWLATFGKILGLDLYFTARKPGW
jgi:SAM-dependent methyltransferase